MYQFLKEHQKQYNIQKACKILCISRSGFYAYLHRRKSKRIIENEALTEIIEEVFHEHQGRYRARRIQQVLLQRNIHVNAKRVSRLMGVHGLIPKGAKKKYQYYPNKTQYEERENILNQVFSAEKKNQIWVGDITYIPIVHTDRGAQYTSKRFGALLLRYGCRQSMSRKGNPYDNAIMESFYRTLKRELVQGANYDNPEQAQIDVFKYIETYYNTKRLHSSLGYLSPCEFENSQIP